MIHMGDDISLSLENDTSKVALNIVPTENKLSDLEKFLQTTKEDK